MRRQHGWYAFALAAIFLPAAPAGAAPQHVVSTSLCTDEYVFRLVPQERIAALSYLAADTHPVVSTIADKVRGIALLRPSTEEVLMRGADLVVLYEGMNPRLRAHLVEAHVPFIEVPWAQSLTQIRAITRNLGRQLDAGDRADAMIAAMDRDLAAARAQAAKPAIRTLVYEPNGYATSGGVTDEILLASGLADVAAQMGPTRSGTIPLEAVIEQAPALLVLNDGDETSASRADLVLLDPALRALGRRTFIAHAALTPLLCPGPWSVSIAPMLAQLGRKAQ